MLNSIDRMPPSLQLISAHGVGAGHLVTLGWSLSVCAMVVMAAMIGVSLGAQQPDSFYDLETNTLEGLPSALSQFRGKVSLVVNVLVDEQVRVYTSVRRPRAITRLLVPG